MACSAHTARLRARQAAAVSPELRTALGNRPYGCSARSLGSGGGLSDWRQRRRLAAVSWSTRGSARSRPACVPRAELTC